MLRASLHLAGCWPQCSWTPIGLPQGSLAAVEGWLVSSKSAMEQCAFQDHLFSYFLLLLARTDLSYTLRSTDSIIINCLPKETVRTSTGLGGLCGKVTPKRMEVFVTMPIKGHGCCHCPGTDENGHEGIRDTPGSDTHVSALLKGKPTSSQ